MKLTAVTLEIDSVTMLEFDRLDFEMDEESQDQVLSHFVRADLELQLLHNVEIDGPFEVSIAADSAALFSDDPLREVRTRYAFTPDVTQKDSLTVAEFELIVGFEDAHVGYRALGFGTGTDAFGRTKLTRFTPSTAFRTRLTLRVRILVGR